jgi:ABC-type polar amino acid transport system ATPase subunit
MLEIQNIYKKFGNVPILNGVDIHVDLGEIACLLGPSGCGKTTILKVLALLEPPDSGRIMVGDKEFVYPAKRRADMSGIYPNLTIVFQQFQLWNHLTVKENLTLPISSFLPERNVILKELVDLLELGDHLEHYPYRISVGQKQRVAIARAILTKPKYLLLDEVTSSLDIEHIKRVGNLIKSLSANGTTIVLTTHLIGFAQAIADKIYFIDKGMVLEKGGTSILTSPNTERLKQFLSFSEPSTGE